MAISLKFYSDTALQVPVSTSSINHLVDGSNDPQDFVFFLGSVNPLNKFQTSVNPGVDQLFAEIINLTPLWVAVTAKTLNETVRTAAKNGYRYKAQSIVGAGNTGASEPTWPLTIGQTVTDGDVVWVNDGKLHESTEIKLALSVAGLNTAIAGAAISLGTTITGSALNNVPIYVRVDDATAIISQFTELGISVLNVQELPI